MSKTLHKKIKYEYECRREMFNLFSFDFIRKLRKEASGVNGYQTGGHMDMVV